MEWIIRNGTIVQPTSVFKGDLLIQGEKIRAVTQCGVLPKAGTEINAEGLIVIPGVIDVHTHFQLPIMDSYTADDFESGSMACAAGGVTTFIDFVTQTKGHSLFDDLSARRSEADGSVYVDYSLHMGITDFNQASIDAMAAIVEMGIPSFKIFLAYREEGWMADDGKLMAVLEKAKQVNGFIGIHGENPFMIEHFTENLLREGKTDVRWHSAARPAATEIEAIQRAIYLTKLTGGSLYVFHLTTMGAAQLVAEARAEGHRIFAETCPHYLTLDDRVYEKDEGWLYPSCPPLRKQEDVNFLWQCLANGNLQSVATDHCSFSRAQKAAGKGLFTKIPRGLPGCETLLPILFSEGVSKGRISLERLVEILCANPAKIFGLDSRKGALLPGFDADITMIDPNKVVTLSYETLHMKADYSPFEGMEVRGWPVTTVSRGEIVFQQGAFTASKGRGRFIERFIK